MKGIDTIAVFAARYAHHRNTAASFAFLQNIRAVKDQLSDNCKKQLVQESHEADYNLDDWASLRDLFDK